MSLDQFQHGIKAYRFGPPTICTRATLVNLAYVLTCNLEIINCS